MLWKSTLPALLLLAALSAGVLAAESSGSADSDDLADRTSRALGRMSLQDTQLKKAGAKPPARRAAHQMPVVAEQPKAGVPMPPQPTAAPEDGAAVPQELADSTFSYSESADGVEACGNGCCDDCCCEPCCCCLCGPPEDCWIRADVLGWWTKGMNTPPLVTTGPDANNPGVIGEPGTEILFGGEEINGGLQIGGKLSGGVWLDACHRWALEADYFSLGEDDGTYRATGLDYPFLSRPFIDAQTGNNAVEAVNNDDLCGQITVGYNTRFQGAGIDLRHNLCCNTDPCEASGTNPSNWNDWSRYCYRLDVLGGYRYYRLDDSLTIREQLMSIAQGGQVAFGTTYDITDSFTSRNEFQGGELGLAGTVYRGRWSLELLAKVAMGNNQSTITIDGSTTTTVPGQTPNTLPGGLLALPSNIGTYEINEFAVIPQMSAQLGYQVTRHWRTYFGYNFLYWANVGRAGDQIDLNVDIRQLPPGQPGTQPAFTYNDTSFWAQGMNAGLEYRW